MSKEEYNTNFLTEIIFKLDFVSDFDAIEKISEIKKKLKPDFDNTSERFEQNINIDLTNNEGHMKSVPIMWLFHDCENVENSSKYIEIGKNHIILDYNANKNDYSDFRDIKKYISLILQLTNIYGLKETNYIGLRYINQIVCEKGNPHSWEELINSDLLSPNLINKYDKPKRFMRNFNFKKEDFNINFNFGQYNSEYPNPIARKEFVLDYDCYSDDINNISDIEIISEKMNEIIYELFEDSIEDKLRKQMKEN